MTQRAAAKGALWSFIVFLAILFFAFLTGCRPVCTNMRRDLRVVGTPAAGADVVLQVAKERAPCTPKKLTGDLSFPVGTITWREEPWTLNGSLVAGDSFSESCDLEVNVLRLEPAPRSALAHEVGHWFWHWCYGRDGESVVNGKRMPDADLVQWFTEVNTEATRRYMERLP